MYFSRDVDVPCTTKERCQRIRRGCWWCSSNSLSLDAVSTNFSFALRLEMKGARQQGQHLEGHRCAHKVALDSNHGANIESIVTNRGDPIPCTKHEDRKCQEKKHTAWLCLLHGFFDNCEISSFLKRHDFSLINVLCYDKRRWLII